VLEAPTHHGLNDGQQAMGKLVAGFRVLNGDAQQVPNGRERLRENGAQPFFRESIGG
jgi:hypothetical protein